MIKLWLKGLARCDLTDVIHSISQVYSYALPVNSPCKAYASSSASWSTTSDGEKEGGGSRGRRMRVRCLRRRVEIADVQPFKVGVRKK